MVMADSIVAKVINLYPVVSFAPKITALKEKNRKIYLQHQTFAMSAASLLNHQMIHVENSAQFLHQQHQEKQVQYQILLQVMIQARKPQFFLR